MAIQNRVSMDELANLAATSADVLSQVRKLMAKPHPRKEAPTFSSGAIADLCRIKRDQIKYLTAKHNLPAGVKVEGSKAKEYSLTDAIEWVSTISNLPKRPKGRKGTVAAVVNYKGGVAKTSTCMSLAQGLTLRGLTVLVVDCDGQGTATQLTGLSPEEDVETEDTVMPYIYGDQPDLSYAVQPTYWHNLFVIPAASGVLAAEFALPAKALQEKGFKFWEVLKAGLEPLRDQFDVILIDTSPSLSHLTINAMMAADALVMPCPPEALDFASSVQFWGVFTELAQHFKGASEKVFDFVTIVYTKAKTNDAARLVKSYMAQAYGSFMNGIEIPDSDAARMASAQLKTIYDLSKPDGSTESYRRYKEPLDKLAEFVHEQLALSWSRK